MSKIDIKSEADTLKDTSGIVSHRGKILDPANARKDEPIEGAESVETPKPKQELKPTPTEVVVESTKVKDPAPALVDPKFVNQEIDEIAQPDEASEDQDAKTENSDVQQPQIFDTKQYHLPIKATHHHRKGTSGATTFLLVVLITMIVGALIASYMDLIDLGFELPFAIL